MTTSADEYLFDSASDLGEEHLACLVTLFDPISTAFLDPVVTEGARCLELGAGSGSIARWLAGCAGEQSTVLAVDIETSRLEAGPVVDVLAHDIDGGVPPGGPWHLIHARLLLAHLPRREEIVEKLVAALAPGGWLVIGDVAVPPFGVTAAPTPSDDELFRRVQHASHHVISPAAGIDFGWAPRIEQRLGRAGLEHIQVQRHSHTATGGSAGCRMHRNLNIQAEGPLRAAGIEQDELDRYRELMLDPRFRAWFYELYYARGQKPAG